MRFCPIGINDFGSHANTEKAHNIADYYSVFEQFRLMHTTEFDIKVCIIGIVVISDWHLYSRINYKILPHLITTVVKKNKQIACRKSSEIRIIDITDSHIDP